MDFTQETVKELRLKLYRREVSATELCSEYVERITDINPDLQALISVMTKRALAEAGEAQLRINKGESGGLSALTGIPCVVSDNIMTKDHKTTCASKMLEDFVPPFDAGVVELLADAPAPLLGKADMNEFSMGCSPKAGTAVSVDIAPFSLTSDTGGALLQSAALCGLTGLRPTYGRVSRYGLAAFASSLDQIGPLAKTAEDCAIILGAIAVKDLRDAVCFGNPDKEDFAEYIGKGVKGLRIAVPEDIPNGYISEETRSVLQNAANELEKQGAELIKITTEMRKYALPVYYIISSAEASSNLSRFDGVNFGLRGEGGTYFEQIADSRTRGFGNEVKRRLMFGNFVLAHENYADYFQKAWVLRHKIRAEYDELFKTADVILTPTVADDCAGVSDDPHIRNYHRDFFTAPPALAGLPAVSTTCGYTPSGIPVGILLTGRRMDEKTVLRVADCLENMFGGRDI